MFRLVIRLRSYKTSYKTSLDVFRNYGCQWHPTGFRRSFHTTWYPAATASNFPIIGIFSKASDDSHSRPKPLAVINAPDLQNTWKGNMWLSALSRFNRMQAIPGFALLYFRSCPDKSIAESWQKLTTSRQIQTLAVCMIAQKDSVSLHPRFDHLSSEVEEPSATWRVSDTWRVSIRSLSWTPTTSSSTQLTFFRFILPVSFQSKRSKGGTTKTMIQYRVPKDVELPFSFNPGVFMQLEQALMTAFTSQCAQSVHVSYKSHKFVTLHQGFEDQQRRIGANAVHRGWSTSQKQKAIKSSRPGHCNNVGHNLFSTLNFKRTNVNCRSLVAWLKWCPLCFFLKYYR